MGTTPVFLLCIAYWEGTVIDHPIAFFLCDSNSAKRSHD